MQDFDNSHTNCKSCQQDASIAQEMLDEKVAKNRAEVFTRWSDVVNRFGPECRWTKLGMIAKRKPDGSMKYRLIESPE